MDDLSWIQEQERLENINQNHFREPMDKIECVSIFIDANNSIEKVLKEKLLLKSLIEEPSIEEPSEESKIENPVTNGVKNVLNRVLTKHAITTFLEPKLESKYALDDILLYNVTVEPNQIQMFSNSSDDSSIKSSPYFNSCNKGDIIIPPSIFIFHNVNAIYFILRERTLELFVPKSIIKSATATAKGKNTKKVRILEPIDLGKDKIKTKKKNRVTRKITSEIGEREGGR